MKKFRRINFKLFDDRNDDVTVGTIVFLVTLGIIYAVLQKKKMDFPCFENMNDLKENINEILSQLIYEYGEL